jgi:hypothetical protein
MYRRGMLVIFVVLCASAVSYGQRRHVAEWNRDYQRCHCINPFTPFEGGGARGYGGGPVRSAPRNYGRSPDWMYRERYEIEMRQEQTSQPRRAGNEVREPVVRARLERERERDRMASRATQATQPSRLSDRLGLAPRIERRDLRGPFAGYLDSRALDRNVGRSTPQRRDSPGRSRSDNSSRSGSSSSSGGESKGWQESNRERLDRVGH